MSQELASRQKKGVRPRTIILILVVVAVVVISALGILYLQNGFSTTPASHPTCELLWDSESGLNFTISNIAYYCDIPWGDIVIRLESSPNDPDTYLEVYWQWTPSQENLTSQDGQLVTESLMTMETHDDLAMFCNVTDISGDGFLGEGDFFTVKLVNDNGLIMGAPCDMILRHLGAVYMCDLEFVP